MKPSQERIIELLSYNKETGDFVWRSNGRNAGCVSSSGHLLIGIDGGVYLAHRLAWLYVNGVWPFAEVDHINGARTDNRWANLRAATRSQNAANTRCHSDNASGRKGVFFNKASKKWQAQICVRGVKYHLGTFPDADTAHLAYVTASQKHFGEFARAA